VNCPACGFENRQDAGFCGECGASLVREIRCPRCQRPNPLGRKFCDGCGAALADAVIDAPAPGPRAPSSFASGRYKVQRLLGEGAKKRVYLARDERLDRDVALALIKTEGLDEAGRIRVRREAQAMGRLGDHPRIVTVYDTGEENGQPYIVSEYMGGGDLETRLEAAERHRLGVDETLAIAAQLCDALEHAHARGVVHRDLKPGNVWLATDGTARLGDFGLALSLDRSRLTQEGMMVGTVAYMPPEQALGRPPDARSDLYALGATLYEMVTGRPPFLGDDAVAIISQHINTPPVAPSWHNPQVPKRLETLILRLLEKDPAKRAASAREVRQLLEAVTSPSAEAAATAGPDDVNPLDRLAGGVFVGREAQVHELRGGLEDALSGKGRIQLLVGEPGIGKTRTAEELATYATLRGAQALWGRCYEGEGAPAYWPWVQIIRAYAHDREPKTLLSEMGPGAADIAEVVSELRERLPGLPAPPQLDAEEARFRLFDSITNFLRNASSQQPIVLIVDDLHWADKPSLLLLQFLTRELEGSRLLVLGTYRDVEVGRQHPLEETLAELARNPRCSRVLLRGLSEPDVARFIEFSAGQTPPAALVQAVYRETEGNPFFVHEVVRLLQADGRLDRPGDVASWSVEIPQGVRQVIGRRLNALSEDCNRVLAIASVIGREFDLRVLARAGELSEDRTLELLEQAEDARIVAGVEGAPGVYRFCHALVRETLYEELRSTRRLRMHRTVAEVLEAFHAGKLEAHLAELAYHFCEAAAGGDVDTAVGYAVRAAERANASLAFEEAVSHTERALSALEAREPVDETRRCELLLALAAAQYRSGAPAKSRETFRRALALAREVGSAELFARAALEEGTMEIFPASLVDWDLIAVLEEALERLPQGASPRRAQTLARLGSQLIWQEEVERSRSLSAQALAMARSVGDPQTLIQALILRVFHLRRPDQLEESILITEEITELSLELGDKNREFISRGNRIPLLTELPDADAADREIGRYSELAEELRQPFARAWAARYRAGRALREGRIADARLDAWLGLTEGRRANPELAAQMFGLHFYMMRRIQGRFREVEEDLRAGVERFPAVALWPSLLACFLAETGRTDEARRVVDRLAADDFAAVREAALPDAPYFLLADGCFGAGIVEPAERLYELFQPWSERYVTVGGSVSLGAARRPLGNLAAMLGRFDAAARHFEMAIAMETQMRALGLLPRAQCDYAKMLLARGEPGDREQALALLDDALATSQRLGLKGWLDPCLETKLHALGLDAGSIGPKGSIDVIADTLGSERPDLAPHAAPDGTVTLMFSDMEGFAAMTDRLGDLEAREVIRVHNAIVREQTSAHGGYEVELQGDGFLLAFSSERSAPLCAIAIQRAFASHSERHPERPIRVRIGLHTGEVLKDADRFFGKTVILAARIAAQARGGEILASSLLKELTESGGDLRFGKAREVKLKGISKTQRVHAVEWE
jgi:class 3 adenylate cyclase